jgi:hypothetical protein
VNPTKSQNNTDAILRSRLPITTGAASFAPHSPQHFTQLR